MGNFIGTYNHTVDSKNRLLLPAKVKASLGEPTLLFLSLGLDGNIDIRTEEEHTKYVDKLASLPLGSKQARELVRRILGSTYMVEVDSASRILIPKNLIEGAKINKEIYIIGTINRYEIWSKEVYDENSSLNEVDLSELAEGIMNDF